MENGDSTPTQELTTTLLDQGEIFLSMLTRPVVQQQLVVALGILLISWVIPKGIERLRHRVDGERPSTANGQVTRIRRWISASYKLLPPIMAFALLNVATLYFFAQGIPSGILANTTVLILLWLIYRMVLSLLYGRFGDASRPYINRIVTPVFLLLLARRVLSTLPGSIPLVDATLSLGSISFSVGRLVNTGIILYMFFVLAWIVRETILHTLPNRLSAERGVIESVATLTRYALISVGILVALGTLGLNFSSLAIVAGGLSVGIGIGLQDIVANFVSGLVLLFEQSLRPGDVVEVDGNLGEVQHISLRATTVLTRAREELIIPNSAFTTLQVKNMTKSDRVVRLSVPFGVSYKCDPQQVKEVAIRTAERHPLVLADPEPDVLFRAYADSSLNFDLLASVAEPQLSPRIRSDLYYMMFKTFKENGIEIPFPQRDVNLGDGWELLAQAEQPTVTAEQTPS